MLCLAGRYLDAKPAVAATNKQCVVGECLSDSDCCPPPSASLAERCRTLGEECEVVMDLDGVPASCIHALSFADSGIVLTCVLEQLVAGFLYIPFPPG